MEACHRDHCREFCQARPSGRVARLASSADALVRRSLLRLSGSEAQLLLGFFSLALLICLRRQLIAVAALLDLALCFGWLRLSPARNLPLILVVAQRPQEHWYASRRLELDGERSPSFLGKYF